MFSASLLGHIALFITGLLCLIVNSGYSYGPIMLALMGLWAWRQRPSLHDSSSTLFAAIVVFAVGQASLALGWGEGWRRAETYLQFLFIIPLIWAVVRLRLDATYWFVGVALGAMLTVSWSLWQRVVLGVERAGGHTYVIQHGDIGMLMGFTSLMGALYFRGRRGWMVLMLVGAVSGLLVSILSGTRGGWVGLPVVGWMAWRAFSPELKRGVRLGVYSIVFFASALMLTVPATGVPSRIGHAVEELARLQQGDYSGESVVPRLMMWQMGLGLILDKPILGWGAEAFEAERDRQIQAGETRLTIPTNHLHNELIDIAVKHGLVGAALLLWLYWSSAAVFRRDLGEKSVQVRALATSGLLLVLLYIDFGLSQTMFYRNSGRVVFIAWLGITYGLWLNERRKAHAG